MNSMKKLRRRKLETGIVIDTTRHREVFNPMALTNSTMGLDIIGTGATGSKIALGLAKLGIKNIRIWDHDVIEEHNIPNQAFFPEMVGDYKVNALCRMAPWAEFEIYNDKYEGQEDLHEVVFLLVDSMSARKKIFEESIRLKRTKLMVETRMGSNLGIIYTINPTNYRHIKFWESRWYPDDQAEVSHCGATISVGPTADIIAGYAVWQYMKWAKSHTIDFLELILSTEGDLLAEGVKEEILCAH